MSTRRVQSSAIKPRTLGTAKAVTPWVRNPSWLALTAVGDSEQRFRGLVAVFPQGTYLALNATTSTGTYTVNWGDGSTPVNVASNTQADYLFDFNDADLAGTNAPVKLTDSGDLVERVDKNNNNIAHGYSNGMEVRFYNIVSTTGLTTAQVYYVINATANNFQVAATAGGTAIALTTNGTATLLPYKQAIVNVTPTTANLLSFDLNRKNTTTGLQAYETGWLDIEVGSPTFTSLTLLSSNVQMGMCERVAVRNIGSITSLTQLLQTYRAVQEVVITASTSAVTNTSNMFINCSRLVTAPLFNTAAVTNMTSMFQSCGSLVTVPFFNTAAATNMTSMFQSCGSLVTVPLFNTAAVISMTNMFNGCSSLVTVPLFNTAVVTSTAGMFASCRSIASVPLFNTTAVTSMDSMFSGCSSLISSPLFNTAAVTNTGSMFGSCPCIATVPLFNMAAVTSMTNMFSGCTSLVTIPLFNTAVVTSTAGMFSGCASLVTVPLFNTALVTNMSFMFNGCTALTNVPLFNTAAVTGTTGNTGMAFMFQNCNALQAIPLFNTAALVNINSMFVSCTSLTSVPALNVSAVSSSANFINIFNNCPSLSRIQASNFKFTFTVAGCRLGATELNEIYTNLPVLNPGVTTVSGTGTVVTYTVNDITAFAAGRTVTITGVSPAAYNLTNVTVATVNVGALQFTVNNAATGTYVTGGVAAIQSDRTITVSNNVGTTGDNPTIATAKGWTVTG